MPQHMSENLFSSVTDIIPICNKYLMCGEIDL